MKRINGLKSKISVTAVVFLGLATLSPAPIKDPQSAKHELPQHSEAQRQAETRYNQTIPIVGSVPAKTNQDGTGVDPVVGDSTAKNIVIAAPLASDQKALDALSEANRRIVQQQQDSAFPWTAAIVTLVVTGGIVLGGRFYLQKFGPAPAPRMAMRGSGKSVILIEDENWK